MQQTPAYDVVNTDNSLAGDLDARHQSQIFCVDAMYTNSGTTQDTDMLVEALATSPNDPRPRNAPSSPLADAATQATVHLFQIAYDEESLSQVEDCYTILDNMDNARPDWYEYWPIRNYLKDHILNEDSLYGFFSPKFRQKTGLSYTDVVTFVQCHAAAADVFLFSPQPDMGAFFLNVFEQAELFDPGLIVTVDLFLQTIGMPLDVGGLVMDSRQIVFSNYFVASPRFWREWLRITEQIYDICEGQPSSLQNSLCRPTTYPGATQRKVFVQERIASLMLTIQPHWRAIAYNPFGMAWSTSRFCEYPIYAYISDALKSAYRTSAFPQYIQAYAHVRESFQNDLSLQGILPPSATAPKSARHPRAHKSKTLLSHLRRRVPVIVPTYNNPTYARKMIEQLRSIETSDVIVVDNNSTSDEMIDFLAELDARVDVIRLEENKGPHHIFLDNSVFEALPQIFCLTDPDIEFNVNMPSDFLEILLSLTEKFSVGKAGLALDISDQDAMRTEKAHHGGEKFHIWEWERQFWTHQVDKLSDGSPVYLADIDTTFALYNKRFFSRSAFYQAVRVAGNFTSLHLPWYRDNGMKPKEDAHYRATQQHSYYVR